MVPIAGYLSPVIGLMFPKTLLPAQFWSLRQRRDYMFQARRGHGDSVNRTLFCFTTAVGLSSTPQRLQLLLCCGGLTRFLLASTSWAIRLNQAEILFACRCHFFRPALAMALIDAPETLLASSITDPRGGSSYFCVCADVDNRGVCKTLYI